MNKYIDDDIKNSPGVYQILNMKNNKSYIGQSIHVRTRLMKHRRLLYKNEHSNSYLQNAWNKNGGNNFSFLVLEYCTKEDLIKKEKEYIQKYNSASHDGGYNIRINNNSNLGLKWSEEQREKMKLAIERNPWFHNHLVSEEAAKKGHEALRNKVWTKEERKAQSDRLKGLKVSDTSRMKLAQQGEKNPAHKLTENDVKEIIALCKTHYCMHDKIAEIYKVSKGNIDLISANNSWKSIDRNSITDEDLQRGIKRINEFTMSVNERIVRGEI